MIIDRSAVTDLLVEYWHDVDHNDGKSAHLFFSADGEMRFDRAFFRGRKAIAEVYANRAARGHRVSRHLVTNIRLSGLSADGVLVESILCLFAQDGRPPRPSVIPTSVADVVDDLRVVEGRLQIVSRVLSNMFLVNVDHLAVPTS